MRHPKLEEPCQHSTSKWRGLCFGVFFSFFIHFNLFQISYSICLPLFTLCIMLKMKVRDWYLAVFLKCWSLANQDSGTLETPYLLTSSHIIIFIFLHYRMSTPHACTWKRKVFLYLWWQRNHLEKRCRFVWPQDVCEGAGQHLKVPSAPSVHVLWSITCLWQ